MLSKIGKWYSEVFLYKVSQWLIIVAGIALIVMMLVNFIVVTFRKFFVAVGWKMGAGIAGGYEITQLAMVFLTACTVSYVWYTAGHVRVGILRDNLRERPRAILDALWAFLAMIYLALIVWGVFIQAGYHFAMGAYTPLNRIPIPPFMVVLYVVAAHACLVFLRSFIGLASKALGKKFARESYLQGQ